MQIDIDRGKGKHSVTACRASAQGHSVTLWKAKGKGILIGHCIINDDSCMHCILFCGHVFRDTKEECCSLPLSHAKASGFIALRRLYNNIVHSSEHHCLMYVYMLIYTQGKGRRSGIACKASAQGHSLEGKGEGHSDWSMHYK